jgi:hypothetical protein
VTDPEIPCSGLRVSDYNQELNRFMGARQVVWMEGRKLAEKRVRQAI